DESLFIDLGIFEEPARVLVKPKPSPSTKQAGGPSNGRGRGGGKHRGRGKPTAGGMGPVTGLPTRPARSTRSGRAYHVTRRGLWVRRLVAALGIFMVVLMVSGVAFFFYAKHKIDEKAVSCTSCSAPVTTAAGAPAPFNVLIVGSDSRQVLDSEDQQLYDPTGVDQSSPQRADTIAVLHVEPGAGKAVLINVPRDLRVPDLNGDGGYTKVNSYYSNGVSQMVQGIENVTGLPISHYVEVNFDSFRTITDALGGVDVYFNQSVYDPNSGLKEPKGCDLVTGDQALAFVRDRDTDSDFGRIARQQLFVKLMMNKVLTPSTLLNPVKVASLINLGLGTVTHDSGLSLGTMLSLFRQFHSLSASDIDFRVLPSYPDNTPIDGQLYVLESTGEAQTLLTALKNNTQLPDYGIQGVSAIEPSQVPTAVLNATGVAGLAAHASDALGHLGYPIEGTGNAPGTPTATAVYYTSGNQSLAQYEETSFPGATVAPLPSTIPLPDTVNASATDVVVVLGQNATTDTTGAAGVVTPAPTPSNLLPDGPAAMIASQSLAKQCPA
ncbi:MAG: LCP family protein, partial [Actinomycetota bacterium]